MKKRILRCPARSVWTAFAVVAFVVALGFASALAQGNASTQGAGDAESASILDDDPQARAILFGMAEFLAAAPAFSVNIRSGYDAIQADGQRIEFGEKRRVTLQRPDRIRIEVQRSDGDSGLVLYDGKSLTAFKADDNVFARLEKNGTVDEMIVYMVRDLRMTLPLARMFLSRFPQSLERMVTNSSLVEEDFLFEVPTDHLAVRSEEVDMQLWVAKGDMPLPRRVVITYRTAPGAPQFWAELSDWNLSPTITTETFSFTPPAGVEQIPLLAPVRQKGSLPMQDGGAQ